MKLDDALHEREPEAEPARASGERGVRLVERLEEMVERARNGFWTGGRLYGYRTVQEPAPANPEHPRYVPVIDEAQAEIVRRIFREYIDGHGYSRIAAGLNRDAVVAPFDGHPTKKRTLGWSMTTVRALLRNEKYVGQWAWNRRQWISISGSKYRRPMQRGDDELVVRELPELAIVSRKAWDAARVRRGQLTKSSRGRHPTAHLFSGLLRCGMCGGGMSVMSTKVKNGKRYVAYWL